MGNIKNIKTEKFKNGKYKNARGKVFGLGRRNGGKLQLVAEPHAHYYSSPPSKYKYKYKWKHKYKYKKYK